MTREDYYATFSNLQEAMESNAAKTPHQRHVMDRYEILICGQVTKLIMKRKDENEQPKHFLFVEEFYAKVVDTVMVTIPSVYRGRCDPRNLIWVVKEKESNGLYTIVINNGILQNKYRRNQFDVYGQAL